MAYGQARPIDIFDRQFTEENGRLFFRCYGKGPAYAVTETQRNEWRKQFKRGQMWLMTGLIGTMLIAVMVIVLATADTGKLSNGAMIWATLVCMVPLFAISLVINRRLFSVPERELEGQQLQVAPALDRKQARATFLQRITYKHLAGIAGLSCILPLRMSGDVDEFHGYGRLVWLFPALIILLAAMQAYRKYRLERQSDPER